MIVGRNLELIPNQRIVQAWRSEQLESGIIFYCKKFDLKPKGANEIVLILDHWGYPEEKKSTWKKAGTSDTEHRCKNI